MKWLITVLIALPFLCFGQQNLVPNGSFEELTACPYGGDVIELAVPWTNAGGGGSPDLFSPCATDVRWGVPNNLRGSQQPRTGEAYAGVFAYNGPHLSEGREYIQVRLLRPLMPDTIYHVTFYVSLADTFNYAVANMGVYFSDSLIVRDNYSALNVEPQVEWSADPITDKLSWTLVEGFYTPHFFGEEYLLVGNFHSDIESTIVLIDSTGDNTGAKSHYYIDDVSVVALDTVSGIGETERLQLNIYPNPATETVQVKGEALAKVRLMEMSGRDVLYSSLLTSGEVDISHLPLGLYLLEVTDRKGRKAVQKLVVE